MKKEKILNLEINQDNLKFNKQIENIFRKYQGDFINTGYFLQDHIRNFQYRFENKELLENAKNEIIDLVKKNKIGYYTSLMKKESEIDERICELLK